MRFKKNPPRYSFSSNKSPVAIKEKSTKKPGSVEIDEAAGTIGFYDLAKKLRCAISGNTTSMPGQKMLADLTDAISGANIKLFSKNGTMTGAWNSDDGSMSIGNLIVRGILYLKTSLSVSSTTSGVERIFTVNATDDNGVLLKNMQLKVRSDAGDEAERYVAVYGEGIGIAGGTVDFYRPLKPGTVGIPKKVISINPGEDGDIHFYGGDCAEEYECEHGELEKGTVVVATGTGSIAESAKAYDKRVQGVVSGANNLSPGIVLNRRDSVSAFRVPVALCGKVYCKVDATRHEIEVGDMLTTSELPGHAKKALNLQDAQGAIIGKALESKRDGIGTLLITVLLA